MEEDRVAQALAHVFTSQNVSDSNLEPANVVDVLDNLANSANRIASAILPNAAPGHDATGGTVISLTEAVMGMTAGLCKIADAIYELADATRQASE